MLRTLTGSQPVLKGRACSGHLNTTAVSRFGVDFGYIMEDIFPCVLPTGEYVVLNKGKACKASCWAALALQGVQRRELAHKKLADEPPALLQDLAGNAFAGNVIAAFLIAGLLVM